VTYNDFPDAPVNTPGPFPTKAWVRPVTTLAVPNSTGQTQTDSLDDQQLSVRGRGLEREWRTFAVDVRATGIDLWSVDPSGRRFPFRIGHHSAEKLDDTFRKARKGLLVGQPAAPRPGVSYWPARGGFGIMAHVAQVTVAGATIQRLDD
jgi:hypothetical protein